MAVELPELSAKICSLYGMHRSQYVTTATREVILRMYVYVEISCSR